MLIMLSLNAVTLIILSGVYFFGMNSVRTRALESVEDIGNRSALNSTGMLEMQKKKKLSLHDEVFCFVLDIHDRMILSSDKKFRFNEKSAVDLRTVDNPAFADIAAQMVDGFKGIREAEYNGKNYYISYAPIEQTDWSFAVVIDAGIVNQPIFGSFRRTDTSII